MQVFDVYQGKGVPDGKKSIAVAVRLLPTERTLTDAEIVNRIRNGKTGAMPAFGSAFNDEQVKAIVKYIRDLKPDGAPKS